VFEATVIEELRAIRAAVDELRAALPRPLRAAREDQALLGLIREATGGRTFSSFELVDHCGLADAAALRAALVAEVGAALAPQRIGKLLKKLSRLDCGEIALARVGHDRLGALWAATMRK
jgi:hypothetical protein